MDLVLYLFAEEDVVRRDPGHERAVAILNGLLKVPAGAAPAATATLTLESTRRPPRVLDKLPLHPPPSAGALSSWKHAIPLAGDDVVTAHWAFGTAQSNRVTLQVASGTAGAALTIDVIPSIGVPGEPHLFARLRNLGGAPIDRPSAFVDCAAIIDGVRSRFRFDAYHGAAELAPGDSLWHLFSLDRCDPRPAPGEHEVVLEMAGHRSSAVRVVNR
jgi:hypothetical protein